MGVEPGVTLGAIELGLLLRKRGPVQVYQGRHVRLGLEVDVHVMTAAPAEDQERFFREARIATAFEHPLVVPVLDFGEHDGIRTLVTECVGGRTLEHHLQERGGHLSPGAIAALLVRIAKLLRDAHRAGIAHRDLSPFHLCVDAEGRLRVSGFALAPERGAYLGTPGPARAEALRYLPPEVGRPQAVRPPSCDLFALGAMAYELAFGRLPYADALLDAGEPTRTLERPRLDLPTDCSRKLVAIIASLVEPDPQERTCASEELLQRLSELPGSSRPSAEVGVRVDAPGSTGALGSERGIGELGSPSRRGPVDPGSERGIGELGSPSRRGPVDPGSERGTGELGSPARGSDPDGRAFLGIARFLERWFGGSRSAHAAGAVLHSSVGERLLVWGMLIALVAAALAGMLGS